MSITIRASIHSIVYTIYVEMMRAQAEGMRENALATRDAWATKNLPRNPQRARSSRFTYMCALDIVYIYEYEKGTRERERETATAIMVNNSLSDCQLHTQGILGPLCVCAAAMLYTADCRARDEPRARTSRHLSCMCVCVSACGSPLKIAKSRTSLLCDETFCWSSI